MILFVTGIDTEIGKTVATGLLAAWFCRRQFRVITYKLVQTGSERDSADIAAHRQLMGTGPLPEDQQRATCGAVYPFPGSPHLAAQLQGRQIDPTRLAAEVRQLATRYDVVLVEGAGGLCVPLTPDELTIDLVQQQRWPVVLVTAPRLGSINHTLLSLEALVARRLQLAAVLYNLHFTAAPEIVADTRSVIQAALHAHFPHTPLVDLPAQVTAAQARQWDPEAGGWSLQSPPGEYS